MDGLLRCSSRVQRLSPFDWSIGPDKGFTTFEDPHPYSGATALIYEIYAGFGDRPGGNVFQAADIKGPRWLDLWRAAEDILSRSRDRHHRFIEQFVQQKSGVLRLRTRELR